MQEWWTYVCMGPSDPHPNWHLGMRGTQHRAVMWRVWKEGGTGFLYWGSNCYEKATVPSAEVLPWLFTSAYFLNTVIWKMLVLAHLTHWNLQCMSDVDPIPTWPSSRWWRIVLSWWSIFYKSTCCFSPSGTLSRWFAGTLFFLASSSTHNLLL